MDPDSELEVPLCNPILFGTSFVVPAPPQHGHWRTMECAATGGAMAGGGATPGPLPRSAHSQSGVPAAALHTLSPRVRVRRCRTSVVATEGQTKGGPASSWSVATHLTPGKN